jgi:ribosome-associated translation inhibitor RaiA
MATRFYFENFEKSESTEAYLRSQIQGVADKFFKDGLYSLYIRTQGEHKRGFLCEVRLDLPNDNPLFIKKEGKDFFQTVKSLGEALKKSVERI